MMAGTRPEAIKFAPIARAAAQRPGIDARLVATGQHLALFDDVVAAFDLAVERNLELFRPGQSIASLTDGISAAVPGLIDEMRPDMLLVQGDTTSAWAAALAGHRAGLPVGHVEAGLRSHDLTNPWPEERNRVEIDRVSSLLFAPTEQALRNLRAERDVRGRTIVTGNSGIDALLTMRHQAYGAGRTLHDGGRRLILVTCHRRENIGDGIAGICEALRRIAARPDVRILLPLHPNPEVRSGVRAALSGTDIQLIDALPYPEMVALMDAAHIILSDSGGLQEEAPALGVPLLVLRDNTERPEALATGNIALVGTDPDRIVAATARLLDDPLAHAAMAVPAFPYGRGDAADRILDAIEDWFGDRHANHAAGPRPTLRLPDLQA